MARRKSSDSGGSLDSLLDTVTNVVGILVIVLVITQLGVSDAMNRIKAHLDTLPEITEQEMARVELDAAEIKMLLETEREREELLDADELPDPEELERQRALIARLKAELERLAKASGNRKEIEKQVAALEKEIAEREAKIKRTLEEIATLRALLDETPEPGDAPPPKVVNLPNPRTAPKGITPVIFLCRNGRVAWVDQDGLRLEALKRIRRIQSRGERQKNVIDCQTLIQEFDKATIGDRDFALRIKVYNGTPQLLPELTESGGDATERLTRRGNRPVFENRLRKMNPQKQYCRFYVWPDSFETYLEARKIVQRHEFLSGWLPFRGEQPWTFPLGGGVTLTCSDDPPKPPPKPTPVDPTARKPLPVSEID